MPQYSWLWKVEVEVDDHSSLLCFLYREVSGTKAPAEHLLSCSLQVFMPLTHHFLEVSRMWQ